MDYKEDRTGANLAEGDVAVFFAVMGKVPNGHGVGIVEHKLGRLEIDVMLSEILLALPLVALETHVATVFEEYQLYIYLSIQPRSVFHLRQNSPASPLSTIARKLQSEAAARGMTRAQHDALMASLKND